MWQDKYNNQRPRTIFALVAPEDDGLIVIVSHSQDVPKRMKAVQRKVSKPYEELVYAEPLAAFIKYCADKGMGWKKRELETYECTSFNAEYSRWLWKQSALSAGLYPKYSWCEEIAIEIVEKVASGQMKLSLPEWPKDLIPNNPFINPYYEYLTANTYKLPVKEKPDLRETTGSNLEANLFSYINYLFDDAQLSISSSRQTNLFTALPHLGNATTALERKGVVTERGDAWLEGDMANRKVAMALISCHFGISTKQENDLAQQDALPPYAHAGIAMRVYKNRNRKLLVAEWKHAIGEMLGALNKPERNERESYIDRVIANFTR